MEHSQREGCYDFSLRVNMGDWDWGAANWDQCVSYFIRYAVAETPLRVQYCELSCQLA